MSVFFSARTTARIAKAILKTHLGLRPNPLYVQFYITARCNLTCKQCNIIYANAACKEASIEEIRAIAKNLRKIGVAIVLLTGGEPFVRTDLPEIVSAFINEGIHVRTQTNGLASIQALNDVVAAGAHDISVSLDSLNESKQDFLNGSHSKSWINAVKTISKISRAFPAANSFAAFGTVISPHNFLEIPNIIRFATEIGWYVSLVPAHITSPSKPLNFRSYDKEMIFPPEIIPLLENILEEAIDLKRKGYNLYDSKEYLRNIVPFIKGESITWRRKNKGICDSPDLYFAIRPDGDMQVCCDHNLNESYPVWHREFPAWFKSRKLHNAIYPIAKDCSGCMYGSYPEITISARYKSVILQRALLFSRTARPKNWPISEEKLLENAESINKKWPVPNIGFEILDNFENHAFATFPRKSLSIMQ